MRKKDRRECTQPRINDSIPWNATPVMKAATYSDRLEEEMEETIAAVVLAETYPETADGHKGKNKDEKEQI